MNKKSIELHFSEWGRWRAAGGCCAISLPMIEPFYTLSALTFSMPQVLPMHQTKGEEKTPNLRTMGDE